METLLTIVTVLLGFAAGVLAARAVRAGKAAPPKPPEPKPPEPKPPEPGEGGALRRLRAEQEAFSLLSRYSAEVAYGLDRGALPEAEEGGGAD